MELFSFTPEIHNDYYEESLDIMTRQEFMDSCQCGFITDEDGSAFAWVDGEEGDEIMMRDWQTIPEHITHIVFYGK